MFRDMAMFCVFRVKSILAIPTQGLFWVWSNPRRRYNVTSAFFGEPTCHCFAELY